MRTTRKFFEELEVDEGDPRFETADAFPDDLDNNVHHVRVSVKFASEARLEVKCIAIQPFKDESIPHGRMGVQLEPARLDDLITALELIRHQHLGDESNGGL